MKILVTGGAGYIGTHTCIELIKAGYDIVVVDNLCNSSLESLNRVEGLVGCNIPFYKVDVRDKIALTRVFEQHSIDGVIHFPVKLLCCVSRISIASCYIAWTPIYNLIRHAST